MNAKTSRNTPRLAAKAAARTPTKRAPSTTSRKPAAAALVPTGSKQSRLIELLRSPSGGTIEQLTQLTGWQPHTVRGAISGTLRKRLNLNVTCTGSVYRIVEARA